MYPDSISHCRCIFGDSLDYKTFKTGPFIKNAQSSTVRVPNSYELILYETSDVQQVSILPKQIKQN